MNPIQKLTMQSLNAEIFSSDVLRWIEEENLWNLWVPKSYGGKESSLAEGLQILKKLAATDGSLGWTVTLCSGANFFIGNLQPQTAEDLFQNKQKPLLGGSGSVSGTAEKRGNHYLINGQWKYATGAPYLTHFTLNARILEEGRPVTEKNGDPVIRSFVIPAKNVRIIEDWNSMGLKATATHSFEVDHLEVSEKFSFLYDRCYLPQPIFHVPFSIFADLTLWVNYIGMAENFLREANPHLNSEKTSPLEKVISKANKKILTYSKSVENTANRAQGFAEGQIQEIHREASGSVRSITNTIIEIYPQLGVKASAEDQMLNQIFRDYFTATQHHIFVK